MAIALAWLEPHGDRGDPGQHVPVAGGPAAAEGEPGAEQQHQLHPERVGRILLQLRRVRDQRRRQRGQGGRGERAQVAEQRAGEQGGQRQRAEAEQQRQQAGPALARGVRDHQVLDQQPARRGRLVQPERREDLGDLLLGHRPVQQQLVQPEGPPTTHCRIRRTAPSATTSQVATRKARSGNRLPSAGHQGRGAGGSSSGAATGWFPAPSSCWSGAAAGAPTPDARGSGVRAGADDQVGEQRHRRR